ncbi:MAG TPA: hypothetical protein VMY99_03285 [Nevskiaceae bacterium]|nr:hypothetical protein [Nevskiaceae bacterium]
MRFISNGDYIFPFQFSQYWAEHFYTWSYQHGAANPDGIMRLPGRLVDLLVFAAFGNLGVAYFYVVSCLAIAFVSFWWFARVFLGAQQRGVLVLGALFFALNPIFLGNLSKVGLVLAVSMLPVALGALKQAFVLKRMSYMFLVVIALNISLLHPFTFTINLLAVGAYAVHLARRHGAWVRDKLPAFAVVAVLALALNAYLLLPLFSLGTVDKGALADTVTKTPVDYTSLVDIANTGDVFTGLSLSKGVLKDYEFYNSITWPFYFLGVFVFYTLLFGVYVRTEKRAKPQDRWRFVLCVGIFLALLALSTATFMHTGTLIKFIIGLPGGWMFRSPLKWQLYMPLVLFAALVIALKHVREGKGLKLLYAAFGCTFVLMNAYLFVQVYKRLLTPRSLTYFGALANVDFSHRNLLFVDSTACMAFAQNHPGVATELNQVFISRQVQVKHVQPGELDTVHVGQFDYVMGCQGNLDTSLLQERYAFARRQSFANDTYMLYQNIKSEAYVAAIPQPFVLETPENISGKYAFVKQTLGQPFTFAANTKGPGLQSVFDTLSPANVQNGALTDTVKPVAPGPQHLYIAGKQQLYYAVQGTRVEITPKASKAVAKVTNAPITVNVPQGRQLQLTYRDPAFSYTNAIQNPSFEQGLWQPKVGDCNAYDKAPDLGMRQDKVMHSHGQASLELTATKHIACTGPGDIAVQPGEHYALSFDYASQGGRYGGYYVSFDDTGMTATGQRLPATNSQWVPFNTDITVPEGATSMHLLFYAYPNNTPGGVGQAHYDNVVLTKVPDVTDKFFMMGGSLNPTSPPGVTFTVLNPTKTLVQVRGAKTGFYLKTKESYNRLWQLKLDPNTHGLQGLLIDTAAVSPHDHIRLNGLMNGWYVDPTALCATQQTGCTHNADGTYDLQLVMSFAPQRWFYVGSVISLIAALAVASYVVFDIWRHKGEKR